VPPGTVGPPRTDADVLLYNEAAAKVMKANSIPVDDLYAVARPRLSELQLPGNVHFKPEGYAALAEQVAASILDAVGKLQKGGRPGGGQR
jgi:lysophospholipase L1-like esterase